MFDSTTIVFCDKAKTRCSLRLKLQGPNRGQLQLRAKSTAIEAGGGFVKVL